MKQKNIISVILGLMVIVAITIAIVPALAASNIADDSPYDFPITPNDDEWVKLKTKQEMLEVCQIPEDKLKNMTTEALYETVLNYPLINSFSAFNSIEDACNVMWEDFNGFRELLSRNDITEILIGKYEIAQVMTASEEKERDISVEEFFLPEVIEYLFACNEIKNGEYSEDQAEVINDLVAEKTNEREESGLYSFASEIYLGYILEKSDVSLFAGENMVATLIQTPNGSYIPYVYIRSPEYTEAEQTRYNEYYDKVWPLANRIGTATIKYNCHSYAWYLRLRTNNYWIDRGPAATYVNDGSYYLYTGTTARTGMIYYYNNGEHSGVSVGNRTEEGKEVPYVRSKWGAAGLYVHAYNYSPYSTSYTLYTNDYK